ncbi:transcription factor SPT20 homolog [Wyeomyia smithii]|uniref:transcription factor SPT20 homolog n=1 Tax=Wyeomyia smithii TaxID=174621 RepID=UPI002467D30A|nr:transcription factor SPT20 homolog [Wyeomyia smithii]
MQWIKILCITVLLLVFASANSDSVDSSFSDDSHSNDSDLKRIRIDPVLRKALLRALRHLKERQEEEESEQQNDSNTTEENFATTILDEILEESVSPERNTKIRYHSYAAETDGDKGDNEIIKTIIISKPRTTLVPPKQDFLQGSVPDPVKERENFVDSNQVTRSVASGSNNNLEESKDEKKPAGDKNIAIITPEPDTTATTQATSTEGVTTPSTTTTEAPTHNADGENIEKVKSEDVKIYQAPLVAAFTVQQDQQGIPRNVIPLIQSPPKKNTAEFKTPTPLSTIPVVQSPPVVTQTQPTTVINTVAQLNTRALEEKNRLLEQQLITLQTQQRIQEQLLRSKIIQEQQLILQQQQQLQQQRFRLEEETQLRLQKFEEEQRFFRQQQQQLQQQQFKVQQQQQQQHQQLFKSHPVQQPQPIIQQSQQLQQPPQFVQELPRNTPAVQFIPSVSLPGKATPISVEQQLPFKEPVEFQPFVLRNSFFEQVKSISPPAQSQFPIIPPSPPQLSKQQLLPLKSFQPFTVNPFPAPPVIPSQLPLDQQLPLVQRNRVFRHETGTGNFGLNLPQTQALPEPQTNVAFRASQPIPIFPQNGGFTPLRNDNQLQNLLVQSGITSRSAEDFNIITKVLALNHGIPQSSSQQMFAKLSPEQQQQLLFRKK